jgi:hypothetical protein
MVAQAVEGIDAFNIAGRSISGWKKTIWEGVGGESK